MPDLSEFYERQPRHKMSHPKGWEPGVVYQEGGEGEISTGPLESEPTGDLWDHLIRDWGLDPEMVEIVPGSIQVRAWDANVGGGEIKRLCYYRATLQPKIAIKVQDEEIDRLIQAIKKKKPVSSKSVDVSRAFLVLLSDWQIGKGEGGGSEASIERIVSAIDRACERLRFLQKGGKPCQSVYLVGLGDMVEQCAGHYAMQTFQTDLDRRQQMRVARHLLLYAVDSFIKFGLPIVVGAVPGNHGENRNSAGKAFTSWTDNDDLAIFEQASEIWEHNPERYGSVSVPLGAIAEDLSMVLDIAGVPVGFIHGHQVRRGSNSQAKLEDWLKGQVLGRQAVGDCEILIAGHLHHFVMSEATGRTILQVPAMDGGSHWWTSMSGQAAPAGMVTLTVGSQVGPRGWSDLLIV